MEIPTKKQLKTLARSIAEVTKEVNKPKIPRVYSFPRTSADSKKFKVRREAQLREERVDKVCELAASVYRGNAEDAVDVAIKIVNAANRKVK